MVTFFSDYKHKRILPWLQKQPCFAWATNQPYFTLTTNTTLFVLTKKNNYILPWLWNQPYFTLTTKTTIFCLGYKNNQILQAACGKNSHSGRERSLGLTYFHSHSSGTSGVIVVFHISMEQCLTSTQTSRYLFSIWNTSQNLSISGTISLGLWLSLCIQQSSGFFLRHECHPLQTCRTRNVQHY